MNPGEAVALLAILLIAAAFFIGVGVGRGRKSTAARGVVEGTGDVVVAARRLVGTAEFAPALPSAVSLKLNELSCALDALDTEKSKALN